MTASQTPPKERPKAASGGSLKVVEQTDPATEGPTPTDEERRATRKAKKEAADAKARPAEKPAKDVSKPKTTAQPVARAKPARRHILAVISFIVMMVIPPGLTAWYLWTKAEDRFVSYTAFSVRTEEITSAFELLGGMAEMGGSSSSDSDILYSFIQSPQLVAELDEELDLRAIWSKGDPSWSGDPIYAYDPPGTIEDLTDYWRRMVRVYSDSGGGLLDVEVQAFTPEDAQTVAQGIYAASSNMINELSAIAQEDATRYATEELEETEARLRDARTALTRFRNETQIVDPSASMQSQMGILASLQTQLAEAQVELDLLEGNENPNDPRQAQITSRIGVIENRITAERQKLGMGSATPPAGEAEGADAFADLVGQYEVLLVEREFAEQAYASARAAYNSAVGEARRQSRYLAAHVRPTLPEDSTQPKRVQLTALVTLFSFLAWSLFILTAYALRDRR